MKKKKLKKQLRNLQSRIAEVEPRIAVLERNSVCRVFSYGGKAMTLQEYAEVTEELISRLKSAGKVKKGG